MSAFKQPLPEANYTQIPNVILDNMCEFTDAEFRIITFVCRHTFGWQREDSKMMSLSFIATGTGMSRQGVINGCFRLKEKGILERFEIGNSFTYRLLVNAVDQSTPLTEIGQRRLPISTKSVNAVDTKKERSIKEKKQREVEVIIPQQLDTAEFTETWMRWVKYRKETRNALTPSTIEAQFKKLAAYGLAGAILSIDQSIANGWRGLFEPRIETQKNEDQTPPQNGF